MSISGQEIHICYCITDKTGNYARLLGTSLYSLLSNTKEDIIVHILHDDTLTGKNKLLINETVNLLHGQVFFYNLDVMMSDELKRIKEELPDLKKLRVSIASVYRLMLGELFLNKAKKIIYLDCDIIVNMDIKELWEEVIPSSGLAAVSDFVIQLNKFNALIIENKVKSNEYFNSGVLLIDLEKFVKNFSLEDGMRELSNGLYDYPDQDILNIFFRGSNTLPEKYNTFANVAFASGGNVKKYIYHYVSNSIDFDMHNPFSKLFFSYFMKTPWCDVEFVGSLARKSAKVTRENVLDVANGFSGRKRIVIADKAMEEYFSEMLRLKENEEFIAEDILESVDLNINYYNEYYIFFIAKDKYHSIKEQLEGLGLKEKVNFAWGNSLLERVDNSQKPVSDYQVFLM